MRHLLCLATALSLFGCATDDFDDDEGFAFRDAEEPGHDKCTRTGDYWKNHNKYANPAYKRIPWPIANSEDVVACGKKLIQWMWTPPKDDAGVILGQQYIPARLNVASGAAVPPEVGDALVEAAALLNTCAMDADDVDVALDLATLLAAYNNGELGVPHCE